MYQYTQDDRTYLTQRADQFQNQVTRFQSKKLSDDQFRSLRLQNGLYQEKHAYMMRVAIPYGVLNGEQLHTLGDIAERYDRGYGHFTTRQNIQFNWLSLDDSTKVLRDLATVDMHAIQTSGKVVRNIVTSDWAGVDLDELTDPRIYCEIIRQWFVAHPEFSWMGGKVKIAVNASKNQKVATQFHDIGLEMVSKNNNLGFRVYVGGGLGAAPMKGQLINEFVQASKVLGYLESILRIYNLHGRRDNPKRTRIKFLLHRIGLESLKSQVDADYQAFIKSRSYFELSPSYVQQIAKQFELPITPIPDYPLIQIKDQAFAQWKQQNVFNNKVKGYSIVSVSLTGAKQKSGNISSKQLKALGDIAKSFSRNELRTTVKQNITLPFVRQDQLYQLWLALKKNGIHQAHQNTCAHIVSCPGSDYCSLAKASSISTTEQIQKKLADNPFFDKIRQTSINISGCENACAHHHIADIGLLGLRKNNQDYFQITLGGGLSQIGQKLGPAIADTNIVSAIEKIANVYLENRQEKNQSIADVLNQVGLQAFKERVYED